MTTFTAVRIYINRLIVKLYSFMMHEGVTKLHTASSESYHTPITVRSGQLLPCIVISVEIIVLDFLPVLVPLMSCLHCSLHATDD